MFHRRIKKLNQDSFKQESSVVKSLPVTTKAIIKKIQEGFKTRIRRTLLCVLASLTQQRRQPRSRFDNSYRRIVTWECRGISIYPEDHTLGGHCKPSTRSGVGKDADQYLKISSGWGQSNRRWPNGIPFLILQPS